jgi:hypothetical protein
MKSVKAKKMGRGENYWNRQGWDSSLSP